MAGAVGRHAAPVLVLVLAFVCAALAGCGSSRPSAPRARPRAAHAGTVTQPPPPQPYRFFSASSLWSEAVAGEPVDPRSRAIVGALSELVASEEGAGDGPWINTVSYSIPVYTVGADQPTVPVILVHHRPNPAISRAWSAVPLPSDAKPAAGTDGELVVWQPSSGRLWEFWRLGHEGGGGGWSAWWGGAIQDVSEGSGVNGPQAWPGGQSTWGLAATSLSVMGGLISLEDLSDGVINHALSMSIPDVRAGEFALPAQRTDGRSTDPLSLPEGAHLRLDPSLDLRFLHLSPVALMIARAAQRYGIIVNNGASIVTFQAQDPVPTGTEPYGGRSGFFGGETPRRVLAGFPWSHLELLEMSLRRSA